MKEYMGAGTLGFILSSTLGWGDVLNAFVLGIIGAATGMLFKAGVDWMKKKWKNRNKN